MHVDSVLEPKHNKVLGNQKKLMYGITAPMRSQRKANKKTKEAPSAPQSTSEPAVRILKRPSHLARGQVIGGSHTKPLKGLEQRRREYEEARLRILGEARNPADDDHDDDIRWVRKSLEAFNMKATQKNKKDLHVTFKIDDTETKPKRRPDKPIYQVKQLILSKQQSSAETVHTKNESNRNARSTNAMNANRLDKRM